MADACGQIVRSLAGHDKGALFCVLDTDGGYLLLCGRYSLPGGFQKITTASLITLVCILLCQALHTSASHAIIGALMILTPGIAFTMGIRDFVHGDYLSGTIRMIDALLIAASIAIGTGLVLSLYSLLTGVVVA